MAQLWCCAERSGRREKWGTGGDVEVARSGSVNACVCGGGTGGGSVVRGQRRWSTLTAPALLVAPLDPAAAVTPDALLAPAAALGATTNGATAESAGVHACGPSAASRAPAYLTRTPVRRLCVAAAASTTDIRGSDDAPKPLHPAAL
jgi:hypothetical protein